ncbi:RAD55 family ATPase [Candidatus Aenigmatarchaeota archaeon]
MAKKTKKKTVVKSAKKTVSKSNKCQRKTFERIASGIPGLDSLIGGGFVKNDVYLITGGTGTGKTMFCSQFLWEGLQKGENGIFFSLEQLPEDILDNAEVFGWDFRKYIKQGSFKIDYQDPFEMVDIISATKAKAKEINAKRVVIDSTSLFGMVFKSEHELRKKLYEVIKHFKSMNAVVLITSEILEDFKSLSRFGVEEFVVDGVILLHYLDFGAGASSNRSLIVRKMRKTKHGTDIYPLDITNDGLKVLKG